MTVSRAMTLEPMGGLDSDLEHLARDEFAHLGDQGAAPGLGEVLVDDDGEGVDGVAADEDVHLDHGGDPGAGEGVVEGGVAAGDGLEAVVEVEDDLVEGKLVGDEGRGCRRRTPCSSGDRVSLRRA